MHHDFKAPISIVSLYAHPLEIIFGNIFALVGPIFFFNCDLFSFYMFIIFGFIDSITDHCGYDIKQRDHDIHHEKTIYNYGSIGLLDYICGTNYITAMKNE
jgi:sterol desaturase/sphingolipid hydroxylase (fatty acid hydroxylase superfamily)